MKKEDAGVTPTTMRVSLTGLVRFHGMDAPYKLPNDDDELSRLHILHHYFKSYFELNILAPILQKPSLIGMDPPCFV
jgi:hypothetical protein